MQLAIYIFLAIVIAAVAVDAIGRLDERRGNRPGRPMSDQPRSRDQRDISTQKIVIDLSKRR